MQRDGLDPKIVDLDFSKSVVSQSKQKDGSLLLVKGPPDLDSKRPTTVKVSLFKIVHSNVCYYFHLISCHVKIEFVAKNDIVNVTYIM